MTLRIILYWQRDSQFRREYFGIYCRIAICIVGLDQMDIPVQDAIAAAEK